MTMPSVLLLVQLATTLPLVGLIWFVQVVAYPQFARVGRGNFAAYHAAHSRHITFVVAPLMLGELAASLAWLHWSPPGESSAVVMGGAALSLLAWLVTGLISVPAHHRLSGGFDPGAHRRLVATNWLRTVAWTARAALLLWIVASSLH